MPATIELQATCNRVVETVSKIAAIGAANALIPTDIVEELLNLASVAGAIALDEEKQASQRSSESTNSYESFTTFRSLTEGDAFRRGERAAGPREMFRANRRSAESAEPASDEERPRQADKSAPAAEYDFSVPGNFAARYL